MIYFTAEELCMIEMLTYFNDVSNIIYDTIGLKKLDLAKLLRLSNHRKNALTGG